MKQSDIAFIILVVAISLTASFFIGGSLIASPESRTKQLLVIEPISDSLSNVADEEYANIFNERATNPAINISVGEEDTNKPFINE